MKKPDWVSWDSVKECLADAHSVNRVKGINMTHYQWPSRKIAETIGDNGVMLVALDGDKLVGTAAIAEKSKQSWYIKGRYAYVCFDGVIPQYSGKGIFKQLDAEREEQAKKLGYNVLLFDTHERNTRRKVVALKSDYRYVGYFQAKSRDHYSVIMVKWLNGCPYSKLYCRMKFLQSKVKTMIRTKLLRR